MKVKVINRSAYDLPQYETAQAAGLDVRANITESITLGPLERALVPTGLPATVWVRCWATVCSRAGFWKKMASISMAHWNTRFMPKIWKPPSVIFSFTILRL